MKSLETHVRTWSTELGEEQSVPRVQIIGRDCTVLVAYGVPNGHHHTISRPVDGKTEGAVSGQVGIFNHRNFSEDSGGVREAIFGNGDYTHTALEERDDEAVVEVVPFGALPEPAGAVKLEPVRGWFGCFEGYEDAYWDGCED